MNRALLVGINYRTGPNKDYPLNGCLNDVHAMAEVITTNFGFNNAANRRMLTEASATTANILERLEWLVDAAQPGDVLYFHYSAHGSQMVTTDYEAGEEADGLDEVLVPFDMDWREKIIKDDDFKRIFSKVPAGVNLTVTLDCCHSGGGLRSGYSFGPEWQSDPIPVKPRFVPMPLDIANRAIGLDIKPKERTIQDPQIVAANDQVGLLVSGCKSSQTSADAWLGNRYMGACTFHMIDILKRSKYSIDYTTLVRTLNRKLKQANFTQNPELNGKADLFSQKFLRPFV